MVSFWGAEVANAFRRDGIIKGRDIAFVRDWLTKKGLQKLCRTFEGMYEK